MTLEELKARHQNQPWQEAVVLFDRLSMEWVVDFRGPDDGLHPLTDAKGCRVSFADEQVAEAAIAGMGLAILPRRVAAHRHGARLAPLHPKLPAVSDTIRLLYRSDMHRTRAASLLTDALVAKARAFGS